LPGKDGAPGIDGKDGSPGKDGRDGLNGKDGAPGRDGERGADGKDGSNGIDGKDGSDGIGVAAIELDVSGKFFDLVLDNGKRFEVQLPEGTKGDPGRDGKDGIDGRDGKDGRDGIHGKDGLPGKDGAPGQDGKDGAPGERGLAGADGIDGLDGRDGVDGRDAASVDDFHASIEGRMLRLGFTLSDGIVVSKDLPLDGMVLDAGIYRSLANYHRGDLVTYGGSAWIAQRSTQTSPPSPDWRLAVRKGRDGKDAEGKDE
jgi:hypothetical protein